MYYPLPFEADRWLTENFVYTRIGDAWYSWTWRGTPLSCDI